MVTHFYFGIKTFLFVKHLYGLGFRKTSQNILTTKKVLLQKKVRQVSNRDFEMKNL